jgi:hypothetical protein
VSLNLEPLELCFMDQDRSMGGVEGVGMIVQVCMEEIGRG